ncbi:MAG: coat protein/nuclear export [Cressdnaviricota sp.]|nr:MAG: coat protein/nuclear export [Cressdnaviricota sp.]
MYTSRKRKAANTLVRKAATLLRTKGKTTLGPYTRSGYSGMGGRRGSYPELKVVDTALTTTIIPTTASITLLNGIATGTDYTNRIGRKIMIKSILFRTTLVPNTSSNTPAGDTTRHMIIYDNQSNGAAPVIADILQNSGINDPMNLNNRDRFRVLFDKYVTMEAAQYAAGTLTAGSPGARQVKLYKKCNLDQVFNNTGSTVASIQTGALYYVVLSGFNNQSTSLWTCRIRFIDN